VIDAAAVMGPQARGRRLVGNEATVLHEHDARHEAVGEVEIVPDRAAAIARAVELAREGDVVLIAGKGAEQGQQFADRTIPFDDREAARDALLALGAAT